MSHIRLLVRGGSAKLILKRALVFVLAIMYVVYFGTIPVYSVRVDTATTRYVAPTGQDIGNCTSAASPCRNIQYAVNESSSGDRILVAQGTYTYEAALDPCPSWARAVFCFVDKSLTILGGYSITNWSTMNPSVNLTIISGQNIYRGVAVMGYNTTTTYLDMEGFTIQNGRAEGPTYVASDPSGVGGGMWILIASVTLKDMIFRNNQAIGDNTTSGDGGAAIGSALRIESSPAGTNSLLQRVIFDNNQSIGGTGPDRGGVAFGALFVYTSTVNIEDSTFTNNLAQAGSSPGNGLSNNDGLFADALGGGIAVENGTINLQRTVLTANQVRGGNASTTGGGAYGAGILVEGVVQYISSFSISDSYLANNTAIAGNAHTGGNAGGGGILATNSLVTIERVKVMLNSAIGGNSIGGGNAGPGAGGGIYLFASRSGIPRATITNVMVNENLAAQGSGVTSLGNGGGGGISVQGMDAEITHATIAQNRLASNLILGQGLGVVPWLLQSGSLPAVVNLNYSIIANHTEGGTLATAIVVQQGSTLTFNRGLFAGNTKDTNASGGPVSPGTINGLSTMLSASSASFFSLGSPNYNYHLRLSSAAKDQAIGSTTSDDIDGQNRPYNGVSDLGADEYWPFALSVVPGNGTLRLDWTAGESVLAGVVNHYEVFLTCAVGAKPPQEGSCGRPINAGAATSFTLTGLTNFKQYTMTVNADDSSDVLIASSIIMTASPTDILLYLPLVIK